MLGTEPGDTEGKKVRQAAIVILFGGAMMRAEAFTVLSWCFASVSREEWEAMTNAQTWTEFLTFLGTETDPSAQRDAALGHLAVPPTYEEKTRFAACHFTGGLPASALPVESLYVPSAGQACGEYCREPAWYLRDLAASLGLEIPAAYAAYPDHLSIELDMTAFLCAANPDHARDFAAQRFGWLADYAARLKSLNANESFYFAAIVVLQCVIDAWCKDR